ncbi:hypothetical protein GX50_06995 [[Emmonsia] crescens]|uniref:Uncharacterized protein n=1 Tax=[Emmonsia] crescens TaxID=73230 RepID=A0A2B7ZBM6_9EURO|nr:hypothetical protein GX50_06995 [Emmonsia crescens]
MARELDTTVTLSIPSEQEEPLAGQPTSKRQSKWYEMGEYQCNKLSTPLSELPREAKRVGL